MEMIREDQRLRKGVCEAVSKWTTTNSDGSIVVMFDQEGEAFLYKHVGSLSVLSLCR